MTIAELTCYLEREIEHFPGQTALVCASPYSETPLFAYRENVSFPSASTIKTPILLAALEQVRRGKCKLNDQLPVPPEVILPDTAVFERGQESYTLEELLTWMIVESDNTATNVLLEALGFDAVNDYCASIALKHTVCRRKMLDADAVKAGRDNRTSAADQWRIFSLLQGGQILTPALRTLALSILRRQRCNDTMLRYIADDVAVAHKTGGLDGVAHDSGIFYLPQQPLYLGIFTWDGPSPDGDPGQRRYIGRLAKAIYDVCKEV